MWPAGKSAFLKEGSAADANRVGNILSSAYYQSSREVSAELGKIMSEKISSTTGQKNRGLKEAPLVVLDGMYYPACLIEAGFLSNAEEAKISFFCFSGKNSPSYCSGSR